MYLPLNPFRIFKQAVGKLQTMVYPPSQYPLHMPRINVKTATQSLISIIVFFAIRLLLSETPLILTILDRNT